MQGMLNHMDGRFMGHGNGLPPQFSNPLQNFNQFHQQQQIPQQQPQLMNQIDPRLMNSNDKRDYYGDQLFTKISSNVNFSQFEEYVKH